ncbi:uncharacterized protein LOC135922770 [Gordionus sp. m RMFG-2023]|uniref:uncharacterized protein LOC135922770 n=1 Tax=Gordionus sp. m RMFG-2023 TaxID=3053472 RepID=UPI0031FBCD99
MCSLIWGRRDKKCRSVRIKSQTLTIEGHNGEEDVMGKVTWLPVQELINGWTENEVDKLISKPDGREVYSDKKLGPYRGPREDSQGRRGEIRPSFDSRVRGIMNCYNCGRQGHMVRDCREAKCFECSRFGHIAPYCPGKQEKLRCAGCGRFGHNKEECNTGNYNTRGGFPQRVIGPNTSTVRTIEDARVGGRGVFPEGVEDQTVECF